MHGPNRRRRARPTPARQWNSWAANNGMLAAVSNFKILTPAAAWIKPDHRSPRSETPRPDADDRGKISCGPELIATGDLSLYA
jgi:hypothetical protein